MREGLPEICPNVEVGELVISELRGTDPVYYLEVYNASGKTVDLQGLVIHIRSTGSDILVRESIELEAGGYAVVAPGTPGDTPLWIDYGFGTDATASFLPESTTTIELDACGEIIDEMSYDAYQLPVDATLACASNGLPSADDNDDSQLGCWCLSSVSGSPGGPNQCL